MKKLLACLLLPILLAAACPSTPVSQGEGQIHNYTPTVPDTLSGYPLEQVSGKSAFDYFKDEGLAVGWNMGNSLDSFSQGIGGETGWGNPRVNQEIMNGVKAAGFNLIRIPVTWMGNFGSAPDHHVSEKRLKRVAEVVEMANKAGLKVIINLHHDGSAESRQKEEGWLTINKIHKNENEVMFRFARIWKQIALYFQNYGDWLMFESFNELHDGGWFWAERNVPANQYAIINELNQIFTDMVRSTGANNAGRFLIYPSYCTGAEALLSNNFKLPDDSAEGKQIVTFHYYRPDDFSLNGKVAIWESSSFKNEVNNLFKKSKDSFIAKNIPVIIGETGPALSNVAPDQKKTAAENRISYISFLYGAAKDNGLVPIYWDNGAASGSGEKFGLFNRTTGQPNSDESRACIEAMIKAVK